MDTILCERKKGVENENNRLKKIKDLSVTLFVRIYLYDDGLVRFASEKYSKEDSSIQNNYIHLTNFAINRENKGQESIKWNLRSLRNHLERKGMINS